MDTNTTENRLIKAGQQKGDPDGLAHVFAWRLRRARKPFDRQDGTRAQEIGQVTFDFGNSTAVNLPIIYSARILAWTEEVGKKQLRRCDVMEQGGCPVPITTERKIEIYRAVKKGLASGSPLPDFMTAATQAGVSDPQSRYFGNSLSYQTLAGESPAAAEGEEGVYNLQK